MNKTVLMGRLTKDPELRYTTNNTAVVNFTLAVDRRIKQEGQPSADYISIVAWNKLAEAINNYCKKGRKIAVVGRIQTRTWDDTENKRHYVTEVVAEEMYFCEAKKPEHQPTEPQVYGAAPGYFPVEDDWIPF